MDTKWTSSSAGNQAISSSPARFRPLHLLRRDSGELYVGEPSCCVFNVHLQFEEFHRLNRLMNSPESTDELAGEDEVAGISPEKMKWPDYRLSWSKTWAVTSDRAVCHSSQRTQVQTLSEEITTASSATQIPIKGVSLLWTRFEPGNIPPETPMRGKLECASDQLIWTSFLWLLVYVKALYKFILYKTLSLKETSRLVIIILLLLTKNPYPFVSNSWPINVHFLAFTFSLHLFKYLSLAYKTQPKTSSVWMKSHDLVIYLPEF
ncbi:hypothetical protein LXL04_015554 [Taraxacum kok-saghyz]